MRKILVTGGTGFLGRHVMALLKTGVRYVVVSVSRKEGVDIFDEESFKKTVRLFKPDILLHCAAHTGGIAYNAKYPVEVFEDNVRIGLTVAKVCNDERIENLVNIIPNCVYPGHLTESEESQFWDGAVHDSVLTYAIPRKTLWTACYAYTKKNPWFKPVHLILPNMYGPYDHFEAVKSHALGGLIAKIVDAKRHGQKSVEIWGTGKPVREWLYVEDGAEAILRTLENFEKLEPNEIMNVGIGMGISILDMAHLIRDAAGWTGEFVLRTEKPDGAMIKTLIAKKMKEKLKWEPTTPLKEGIQKTVEWYERQGKNQ